MNQKKQYYSRYNQYIKDFIGEDGSAQNKAYNELGEATRTAIYDRIDALALKEARESYYGRIDDVDKLYSKNDGDLKAAKYLAQNGLNPANFFEMKQNGLDGKQQALYMANELEQAGVLNQAINGAYRGYYELSSIGLTESVAKMTADERYEAEEESLETYGMKPEMFASAYRSAEDKEERQALVDAWKNARNDYLAEKKEKGRETDQLIQSRAVATGMTDAQYKKYADIKADKRVTGGDISYTRQLKVADAMLTDGTWDSYRNAYESGELNQDDLSKLGLNTTFLGWTDEAISAAVEKYKAGQWVDYDTFKEEYEADGKKVTKKATQQAAEKAAKTAKSTASKSAKTATASVEKAQKEAEADAKAQRSLFASLMRSNSPSSNIKADVSSSDQALWDRIVNSSSSDLEKLRRELKL